jgi:amyloid beta (A4) precursor protein-binding family B protein 2 (Fe65-like)
MLPKGWQRMTDDQGRAYYWHIPSGQTQYTKPTGVAIENLLSLSLEDSGHQLSDQSDHSAHSSVPNVAAHTQSEVKGQRFSARYLGSHPVEESELVPGECVKVVHQSIRRTNASGSTKGQPIFLVIRGMELQWVEPEASSPTTIQPINRIRVWGIGLENDRQFGYVARDQVTKKHKCHVFRCEMPARAVAKALLENHQKMSKAPPTAPVTTTTTATPGGGVGSEQTAPQQRSGGSPELPPSTGRGRHERTQTVSGTKSGSPPSSGGESSENMACVYMGSCEVRQPQGIDILNAAVEKLCSNKTRWVNANISIATSNIRITDAKSEKAISEHRVRYLCFLGIATDDRYCGYILESARGRKPTEKKFLFHGFKLEPNTDKLCLALHTACQARYQRALEAQNESHRATRETERLRSKSTSSILGRLGSFKKNRKEEEAKVFTVQYLGCQQVTRSEGLEVVKGPIQQLSVPKAAVGSAPANLVEFEVSPTGLGVSDPQRRLFSRKNFSVKHITYVVRIRNYFAFVVRDGGRYQCHVFLETGVPAATIVTTIQRMLAPEPSKKR